MNRNASFNRKVAYSIGIVLLLLVISRLGQPESPNNKGGILAEMRRENGLAQADLGAIDPAGETMKLATLGMRGVAANLLWHQAIHYKKTENWDSLSATLNQITKLQPNFVSVWEFQAHNLAYNISTNFDDYRHRYHWVKKGLTFLMSGTKYNRKEPRLLVSVGRYFGQKIGRSDEAKQFRELFREDKDFHRSFSEHVNVDDAIGQDTYPDNWLVGRLFFLKAEKLVETEGVPIRGDSPLLFYANAPKARMSYCMSNEKDGNHGGRAVQSWREALADWTEFGSRQIPTSFGHNLKLNEEEEVLQQVRHWEAAFEELRPHLREEIREERRAALPKAEKAALELEITDRSPQDYATIMRAEAKLQVSYEDAVEHLPANVRERGGVLAAKIKDLSTLQDRINRYRNVVNFNYWKMRCEVESLENTDLARQLIYDANHALLKESDLLQAKKKFDQAFDRWFVVFDEYPQLLTDDLAEDLMESIKSYQRLLDQLGDEFPKDFVLQKLVASQASPYPDEAAKPETPKEEAKTEEPEKSEPPTEEPAKKKAEAKPAEAKPAEADKNPPKPEVKEPAKEKPAEKKPEKKAEPPAADKEKPADPESDSEN